MRFEAKKKDLSAALTAIKNLTEAVDISDGSSAAIRLVAKDGKGLFLASMFAESKVSGKSVSIEEDGEVTLDMKSFTQSLSVTGDKFSFQHSGKDSTAQVRCGRSKGRVSVRTEGYSDELFKSAPAASIHAPGLKHVLQSIGLKAPGGTASDRTLHFDADGTLTGETSDSMRGIYVKSSIEGTKIKSSALNLPQKACDALSKLVTDSKVGYDGSVFHVRTAGLRAIIPLSSDAPLTIEEQLTEYLSEQTCHGTLTVSPTELRSALSDVEAMIGKDSGASVEVTLTDALEASVLGKSDSGDVSATFELLDSKIENGVTLTLQIGHLKDCLGFYAQDKVSLVVYDTCLTIDLSDAEEMVSLQVTMIPYQSPAQELETEKPKKKAASKPAKKKAAKKKPAKKKAAPEPEEEDDFEEEEEAPKTAKKAKKKKKAPEPEPESEEEGEEEEEEDETEDDDFDDEMDSLDEDDDEEEDDDDEFDDEDED